MYMHIKRPFVWITPLSLLVALAMLFGCYHLAHAAAGVLDVSPVLPIPSWMIWLGAILAALAGVETVLRGVSMTLHAIAPHTATTVDDRLADRVDGLHDKIDGLVKSLTPIVPGSALASSAPAPVMPSAISSVVKATVIAVLIAGAGLITSQLACSSPAVQQVKTDGKVAAAAVLDCEKKLGPGQLAAGVALLAVDLVQRATAGTPIDSDALAAAAIADLTEVKTCALAEYHAVIAASKPAAPLPDGLATGVMTLSTPDPVAAALVKVKAARGVTAIVTPGGSV